MPIKINFKEKFEPNMSKVRITQRGVLWAPPFSPHHLCSFSFLTSSTHEHLDRQIVMGTSLCLCFVCYANLLLTWDLVLMVKLRVKCQTNHPNLIQSRVV